MNDDTPGRQNCPDRAMFEFSEWSQARREVRWAIADIRTLTVECRTLIVWTLVLFGFALGFTAVAAAAQQSLCVLLASGAALGGLLTLINYVFQSRALRATRERYLEAEAALAQHGSLLAPHPPAGYMIARIEHLDDDERLRLVPYSADAFPSIDAARQELRDANNSRPGWRLYVFKERE